jgi:NAD(P)H-dependent FMN reductase
VTPEYNYGYPASLKNAIDFLHKQWQYKPVGFVSYGGVAAGTRSVQQLKQVVTALKMVPLFEAVTFPSIRNSTTTTGFSCPMRSHHTPHKACWTNCIESKLAFVSCEDSRMQ